MKQCLKCKKEIGKDTKYDTCFPCRRHLCPKCEKRMTGNELCGYCKGKEQKRLEVKTGGKLSRGFAGR